MLFRALNRTEAKLRGSLDHIETTGRSENEGGAQITSQLMDDIQVAVIDYQVRGTLKPFLRSSHSDKIHLDGTPTGHI